MLKSKIRFGLLVLLLLLLCSYLSLQDDPGSLPPTQLSPAERLQALEWLNPPALPTHAEVVVPLVPQAEPKHLVKISGPMAVQLDGSWRITVDGGAASDLRYFALVNKSASAYGSGSISCTFQGKGQVQFDECRIESLNGRGAVTISSEKHVQLLGDDAGVFAVDHCLDVSLQGSSTAKQLLAHDCDSVMVSDGNSVYALRCRVMSCSYGAQGKAKDCGVLIALGKGTNIEHQGSAQTVSIDGGQINIHK